MEKIEKSIPNFDDVDLGIAAIVIICVTGFIVGWLMKLDGALIMAFGGQGLVGVAALVRGLKRTPSKPIEAEPKPDLN